ncbi:MAG TPA: enoyl-CoA hydratase-related protein, partial [Longimicrobiales bacterium]|nr:enoyl-CoA hydratase-related protein [Longimicrobiales bacterium]
VRRIDEMSKPVIAAVNGPAAGAGACLALACDLRVASSSASIGFTFARVGLHPDWGGSYFLPRLVGPALAAELIYTGGMIGAERAEQLGLFNIVVAPDALENAARTLAGQIASGPRQVITAAKKILRTSLTLPLASVLELETEAQLNAFRSPDFREGLHAFMEKRTPRFNGK